MEWTRRRWGVAKQGILLANERIAGVGRRRADRRPPRDRPLPAAALRAPAGHHDRLRRPRCRRGPGRPGRRLGLDAGRLRHGDLPSDPRELGAWRSSRPGRRAAAGCPSWCSATSSRRRPVPRARCSTAAGDEVRFPGAIYEPETVLALRFHGARLPPRSHRRRDEPVAGRGDGRRQRRDRPRQRLQPLGRRGGQPYFTPSTTSPRPWTRSPTTGGRRRMGERPAERVTGRVHLGTHRRPVRAGAAPGAGSPLTDVGQPGALSDDHGRASSASARWGCPTCPWSGAPRRELVGVCDSTGYVLDVLASTPGADLHRLRDHARRGASPDAVIIATPSHLHAPMVRQALDPASTCSARSRSFLDPAETARADRAGRPSAAWSPRSATTTGSSARSGRSSGCSTPARSAAVTTCSAEAYGPVVLKPPGAPGAASGQPAAAASTTTPPTRSTCSPGTSASPARSTGST